MTLVDLMIFLVILHALTFLLTVAMYHKLRRLVDQRSRQGSEQL